MLKLGPKINLKVKTDLTIPFRSQFYSIITKKMQRSTHMIFQKQLLKFGTTNFGQNLKSSRYNNFKNYHIEDYKNDQIEEFEIKNKYFFNNVNASISASGYFPSTFKHILKMLIQLWKIISNSNDVRFGYFKWLQFFFEILYPYIICKKSSIQVATNEATNDVMFLHAYTWNDTTKTLIRRMKKLKILKWGGFVTSRLHSPS